MQNADDASFQNTQSPHLTFTITPKELHIDSNEDGFTLANVVAICSAGESSKVRSSSTTTIGEKGVGFKSVFKIANYVSIKSGYWSFAFDYDRNLPMTMVRPIIQEKGKRPPGVQTRITLCYEEKDAHILLRELQTLPDTAIIFLRNITRVSIFVRGFPASEVEFHAREMARTIKPITSNDARLDRRFDLVTVRTSISNNSLRPIENTLYFRLFKQTYKGMPTEEKRPGITTSEVQLAFPVQSVNGPPQISSGGEYIFAFLPLSRQEHLPVSHKLFFLQPVFYPSLTDIVSHPI